MMRYVLIAAGGGAIGTVLRYLSQRVAGQMIPSAFPWGTFAVNMIGCLLIGICWGLSLRWQSFSTDWKVFLMTGICGGFTTFSAFTLEGMMLLKEQRVGLFFIYVGLSVIAGLLATWGGMRMVS